MNESTTLVQHTPPLEAVLAEVLHPHLFLRWLERDPAGLVFLSGTPSILAAWAEHYLEAMCPGLSFQVLLCLYSRPGLPSGTIVIRAGGQECLAPEWFAPHFPLGYFNTFSTKWQIIALLRRICAEQMFSP